MPTFAEVITSILEKTLAIQMPADDMNAGMQFIEDGRDRHEAFEDDPGLKKSVVPQHYLPEMGNVHMLWKSLPQGATLFKASTLNEDITDREIVVGGYASPQVIDREKHLIEKDAMAADLPRFLANPLFANAMILHSNVQVGTVLPEWEHPETGTIYTTHVDDIGLFCVIKIRTDKYRPKICDKVVEDIEKGSLKAFSISGDAPVESRKHQCVDGVCFWVIPEIEFYEITLCEEGVNQDAKLMVLNKACTDGSCGLAAPEDEFREEAEKAGVEPENVEALRERVEEIAEKVGEEEATRMVEDAVDAAQKLDAAEHKGVGIGTGPASTMSDFAQPYNAQAEQPDAEVEAMASAYEQKLDAGGSAEQVYFEMLENGAPDWFGTRDGKFRDFLLQAHRRKLPIPTVRLRMAGNNEQEGIIADPQFTAWDLLATALKRGLVEKDVSRVHHTHTPDGGKQSGERGKRGLVDERGMREGGGHREQEEPDEGEKWYLNLALDALNKGDSTLRAIAGSKIHEAYTVAMDGMYRLGHMNREERIGLSSAITDALDAFEKKVGDIGDREIPGEDVALLMKSGRNATPNKYKTWVPKGEKNSALLHGQTGASSHTHNGVSHSHATGTHAAPRHADDFREFSTKRPANKALISAHKGPDIKPHPHGRRRGYVQSDQAQWHRKRAEGSVQREKRFVPKRGDKVRFNPSEPDLQHLRGYPAVVTRDADENDYIGVAYRNPRQRSNVKRIHVPASEVAPRGRKLDNYALPVEVGRVNELQIIEGGHENPMEIVREQVAKSRFAGVIYQALISKKDGLGVAARDYLIDPKQQEEPDNVAVQAGVRKAPPSGGPPKPAPKVAAPKPKPITAPPAVAMPAKPNLGPAQGGEKAVGHGNIPMPQVKKRGAVSEIESNADMGGGHIATEPMEQAPEGHGIAQQGVVNPPVGIQGTGSIPKYVVAEDGEDRGIRTDNEGVSQDPRTDVDPRGAPINR